YRLEGCAEIVDAADRKKLDRESELLCRGLGFAQLSLYSRVQLVADRGDPLQRGHRFLQQREAFAGQLGGERGDARDAAAGVRKASDQGRLAPGAPEPFEE